METVTISLKNCTYKFFLFTFLQVQYIILKSVHCIEITLKISDIIVRSGLEQSLSVVLYCSWQFVRQLYFVWLTNNDSVIYSIALQ